MQLVRHSIFQVPCRSYFLATPREKRHYFEKRSLFIYLQVVRPSNLGFAGALIASRGSSFVLFYIGHCRHRSGTRSTSAAAVGALTISRQGVSLGSFRSVSARNLHGTCTRYASFTEPFISSSLVMPCYLPASSHNPPLSSSSWILPFFSLMRVALVIAASPARSNRA